MCEEADNELHTRLSSAALREEEEAGQALHVPQDPDEDHRPQEHQRQG